MEFNDGTDYFGRKPIEHGHSCENVAPGSDTTSAFIASEGLGKVRVFASASCSNDSLSWAVRIDHFDSLEEFSIDALIETFDTRKFSNSHYTGGQFSIQIPYGLWAMVTDGTDGSGDFRLLKGQPVSVCQTLEADFIDKSIAN